MEGPRPIKHEEIEQTLKLVNQVFRLSHGENPTMGEEYPTLFSEDNYENVIIIKDQEKAVSTVSYYPSTVLIEGHQLKAASIGSVCTDDNYRQQGLASKILDYIEERLTKEGYDIMLVSGGRGLYLRRNCTVVSGFIKADFNSQESTSPDIELVEYTDSLIHQLISIYNQEPVRFYRQFTEFKMLLKGATTPWADYKYQVLLLKKQAHYRAYLVLRINQEKNNGEIVEFAGERADIYQVIPLLVNRYNLKEISLNTHQQDPIISYFKEKVCNYQYSNQLGTVKIINFVSLMNKLRPYFKQVLPGEKVDLLKFKESNDTYHLIYGEEQFIIDGLEDLNHLIFSNKTEGSKRLVLESSLNQTPVIKDFCQAVFPLPFPWAGNINYI